VVHEHDAVIAVVRAASDGDPRESQLLEEEVGQIGEGEPVLDERLDDADVIGAVAHAAREHVVTPSVRRGARCESAERRL
jgi:hypothetical protein